MWETREMVRHLYPTTSLALTLAFSLTLALSQEERELNAQGKVAAGFTPRGHCEIWKSRLRLDVYLKLDNVKLLRSLRPPRPL